MNSLLIKIIPVIFNDSPNSILNLGVDGATQFQIPLELQIMYIMFPTNDVCSYREWLWLFWLYVV